jgi:poly-beta-1,6-N-acetyl-D-glucosamine synthase
MMSSVESYVIITPAHNEESYLRFVLDSVINQTIKPAQWIIVDDGSCDNTAEIVQNYASIHPWIKLVKNSPKEVKRQGGGKVIEAFNMGYKALEFSDFEFIVKLDADVTLPADYFEEVLGIFKADLSVGLCGGYLSEYSNGRWKKTQTASYHLRGAIKAYRKKCFDQIGGLDVTLHWDFLDEMKAMYFGWAIKILPLEVKHHRKTSTLINRGLKSSFTIGKQYYKHGYDLFLAICRSAIFGLQTRPFLLTSFGFLLGFLYGCLFRLQKEVNPELEGFIRKFQYSRIKNILIENFYDRPV